MVEVDIQVPEHLKTYFEEMSPIFCTCDVPVSAMGSLMQDHITKYNMSTKPRRLLIGGMKAKKILLLTPLLKWYIDHGLEVTEVYQVIEFIIVNKIHFVDITFFILFSPPPPPPHSTTATTTFHHHHHIPPPPHSTTTATTTFHHHHHHIPPPHSTTTTTTFDHHHHIPPHSTTTATTTFHHHIPPPPPHSTKFYIIYLGNSRGNCN